MNCHCADDRRSARGRAGLPSPAASTETVDAGDGDRTRIATESSAQSADQPPFDRVTMDGIAFAWSDYDLAEDNQNRYSLPVQAMQAAGDPVADACRRALHRDHDRRMRCRRTPNCIVPVERITVVDGNAEIDSEYEVKKGRFVHPRGSDYAKGAHLLTAGKVISPLDIAVIASCGITELEVATDPLVRVISTGNELVAAGQPIEAHQIRLSNGPALVSLLGSHGYRRVEHDHIVDDVDTLRERLAAASSGGQRFGLEWWCVDGQGRLRT